MEIKTLEGIDLNELLGTFNESFSQYFIPLQLSADQLNAKLKADKVAFNYSAGAFTDNTLVGFILHGFDTINNKKTIYNGGTGVIQGYRSRGLTKQMYEFILPILKKENIETLTLEVITQNTAAIKCYETAGFRIKRKLLCYKGMISAIKSDHINILEIPELNWERIKSYWDFSPTWQNSINILQESKEVNVYYGAFLDDELVGYIIHNPLTKRIQQFAVDKKYRRNKIATSLFAHIKSREAVASIINVDECSKGTNEFLTQIGFEPFIEQFEMELRLT